MSSTASPPTSGLSEDQKVIVAVVCSVAGLALIALLIRCLVPRCRKKKYKKEPDDRSLVQSTQSLANFENQFFYSGPVIPPRGAKSESSHVTQTRPVAHSLQDNHIYVNTAAEEFRDSSAWVSGFDISRQISQEEETVQDTNLDSAPPVVDQEVRGDMRGDYSRQNSSEVYSYARRAQPVTSRVTRYETRQEIIREEGPRVVQAERNVRTNLRDRHASVETSRNTEYDMPPRVPRVVETTQTKIVAREPLLKSQTKPKRPQHYIRSMNSESGWNNTQAIEQVQKPTWIDHALEMPNPGLLLRPPAPVPITNVVPSVTQTSRSSRGECEQLSATDILHSRPYIEGAPVEPPPRDSLDWNELKKYGHYEERRGPGTRTIYSMGKDAIRTPELREYVRGGHYRQDSHAQNAYGNASAALLGSHRGDDSSSPMGRRGRDYAYVPGRSGGFVAIDSDTVPTYLPPESEQRSRRDSVETNNHLNLQLSSYLNNGSLKPLDMSSQYRDNWDNQFDPYGLQERALNHYTHPSENRELGPDVPTWYEAQQNRQYQEMLELQQQRQLNQNLFKPIKQGKGKKGKGKSK